MKTTLESWQRHYDNLTPEDCEPKQRPEKDEPDDDGDFEYQQALKHDPYGIGPWKG
jgi:hypothetical protein